jgi:hypothetical protein
MTGVIESERSQPVRSNEVSDHEVSDSDAASQEISAHAEVRSVVRWVVVTSWRGDDGSRMVLTTVRTASPQQVVTDGSTATNALSQQDQVHPYAAVPVRDGWLVIQL